MFTTVYHWPCSKPEEYPCNDILPQPFSLFSCINMLLPYQYYKYTVTAVPALCHLMNGEREVKHHTF